MPVTDCLAPASERSTANIDDVDERFLYAFEHCELPECQWTHLAHIRVAWICLRLLPPAAALARLREGILRYNTEVLDRRNKYHETVTVAFTRIVSDRMRDGDTWSDFAGRISDLLSTENPVLLSYYSENRLFSDDARTEFVEPDLKRLPPYPRAQEIQCADD
jgi:hypothetical protein